MQVSHMPVAMPMSAAGLFSRELYDQAQAYSVDKWWFGFWHGLYNLAETVVWLQVCFGYCIHSL
jgi:hypothetical protein